MTEIVITLSEGGADDVRLDDLGRLLVAELSELPDATSVNSLHLGEAPPGTRGGLVAQAGALVVEAQPQVAAVVAIVTSLWGWVKRSGHGSRTIRIEVDGDILELSGTTDSVQNTLVADWIARHTVE